jgi:peptidoglycan/xylan/chitin deacetylase (PgdA/CDA1 family)
VSKPERREAHAVTRQLVLRGFYRAKPLIPRRAQIAARRRRASRIWRQLGRDPCQHIPSGPLNYPWPDGAQACVVLTHDVELASGQRHVELLTSIEEELGLRSCWNFVVRRYEVDVALVKRLRERGHEIGVHGVYHDGKLFESKAAFRHGLAVMEEAARRWGACGFRSPSLLYDLELLRTVTFRWDSSMPARDPFQPKPGDCHQYVPFALNGQCVELPVTMWQDFTLFEELQLTDIDVWRAQADAIYSAGGMMNVIVHPDYMLTAPRRRLYRALLEHLRGKEALWFARPSEVAAWHQHQTIARTGH